MRISYRSRGSKYYQLLLGFYCYDFVFQGALVLKDFMALRRIPVTKDDMILMLMNDDMDTPPEIHKFSADAATKLHEIGKHDESVRITYSNYVICYW